MGGKKEEGSCASQKDAGEACAHADGEKNKHGEAKSGLCSVWVIKKTTTKRYLLGMLPASLNHYFLNPSYL